jgi:hypothetical protein
MGKSWLCAAELWRLLVGLCEIGFGLHQPQRELTIRTGVARDEVSDMLGDGSAIDVASGLNFEGDIFCNVLRPMLKRVEGDDAERVVKLSRQQIGDDCFEVGPLEFGLAVDGTQSAETVDHEVYGLVRAVGYNPWRPAGARHTHLPRQQHRQFKHETGNGSCTKERPRIAPRALRPDWVHPPDRSSTYVATPNAPVNVALAVWSGSDMVRAGGDGMEREAKLWAHASSSRH